MHPTPPPPATASSVLASRSRDWRSETPSVSSSLCGPTCWSASSPSGPCRVRPLDYLADQEIPVVVATSSDRDYAAFSLKMAGLEARRFAHLVTGEQVEQGKP